MRLFTFLSLVLFAAPVLAQNHWGEPIYKHVPAREQYSSLPQSPTRVFVSDQPVRAGANSKLLIFGRSSTAQVLSLRQAEIDERGILSASLPDSSVLGENSLFYMKDDVSTDIVFTNNSRTEIFYASADLGYPIVSNNICRGFQKISDIHLVEVNGATHRLIVADHGANRVYSYVLNPNDPNLCTGEQSASILGPLWIRSPNPGAVANTEFYLGSQNRYSLNLTRYRADNLAVLTATETLANDRGNSFGQPLINPNTNELYVSIRATKDATNGDDHIRRYLADFSDSSTFKTCRSPDQVLYDYEGGDAYIYVFCSQARKVYVFDGTDERLAILDAGPSPRKMLVGSDGVDRLIAVIQKNARIQLHSFPEDAELIQSEATSVLLDLPFAASDMGQFAALDEAVLVGDNAQGILFVDLKAQSLRDHMRLPRSIDDLYVSGANDSHFISRESLSAYSWSSVGGNRWELIGYDLDSEPLQAKGAGNLLYVISRNPDELNIINTTSGVITTLALPAEPTQFDFDADLEELWIIYEDADQYSVVDIETGSEGIDSTNALGFSPALIRFNDADDTIYIAGGELVRVIAQADLSVLKTLDFDFPVHFMELEAAGVRIASRNSYSSFLVTRATEVEREQDRPTDHLVSNSTDTWIASAQTKALDPDAGFEVQGGVRALFSSLSYFFVRTFSGSLRVFPYESGSLSWFPVDLAIEADLIGSDASDNIWIGDSDRRLFQRLGAGLQPDQLRNARRNLISDMVGDSTLARLYSVLQTSSFFAVTNLNTRATAVYATCQEPTQLLLDQDQDQVYVLCPQSNALVVYGLDGSGDVNSQTFVSLASRPEKLALHEADHLLFISRPSAERVDVVDTTDLSFDGSLNIRARPRDLFVDTVGDRLLVASETSKDITVVELTHFSANSLPTGVRALDRVILGGEIHAMSRSLGSLFHESSDFAAVNQIIEESSRPEDFAYSAGNEKLFITYPSAGALRIFDEDALTSTDYDLDSPVRLIEVREALNRVFLSARDSDEVVAINSATNAEAFRVDLSEGCRPTKMQALSPGGNHFLYVACSGSDLIEIIDLSDNSLGSPLLMRLPEL